MDKIHSVKVLRLDPLIEEEVRLLVNGVEITAFLGACPYVVEEGKTYPATLRLVFLNELNFMQLSEAKETLDRVDETFSYSISGCFTHGKLLSQGIQFSADDLEGMDYLEGSYIHVTADRINASFET